VLGLRFAVVFGFGGFEFGGVVTGNIETVSEETCIELEKEGDEVFMRTKEFLPADDGLQNFIFNLSNETVTS
jgi:hypothetical protein